MRCVPIGVFSISWHQFHKACDWRKLSHLTVGNLSLVAEGSQFTEARYLPFCSLLSNFSLLLCKRHTSIFSVMLLGKSSVLYTEKYGTWKATSPTAGMGKLWRCVVHQKRLDYKVHPPSSLNMLAGMNEKNCTPTRLEKPNPPHPCHTLLPTV